MLAVLAVAAILAHRTQRSGPLLRRATSPVLVVAAFIRRPRAWGSGSREWDPNVAPALYEELPVAQTATVVRGPDGRPAGGLVIVDPIADG